MSEVPLYARFGMRGEGGGLITLKARPMAKILSTSDPQVSSAPAVVNIPTLSESSTCNNSRV